jgi:succinate-acetate transporter protein
MEQKIANPGPLGLLCFGMTTVLLNIHNAGFFPIESNVLGMGLFVGGLAQVLAGQWEFKKGNTFAATAFTAYGFFWIALVSLILLPKIIPSVEATSLANMGWFLVVWGVFSLFMWVGTFPKNRALQFTFFTLVILFLLLAIRDFTGNEMIGIIAGWEGIICGASAIYLSAAEMLAEVYGREILPIGTMQPAKNKK